MLHESFEYLLANGTYAYVQAVYFVDPGHPAADPVTGHVHVSISNGHLDFTGATLLPAGTIAVAEIQAEADYLAAQEAAATAANAVAEANYLAAKTELISAGLPMSAVDALLKLVQPNGA